MNMTPNPAGPSSDTDGNLNYAPSVRVYATLHDTTAGIVRAEVWYEPTDGHGNPVPPTVSGNPDPAKFTNGQGVLMTASRGQWDLTPRLDDATVTSGSSTVLDPSIKTADEGRSVSGTGIPAGATVGQVIAKGGDPSTYSFVIMVNGVATAATASPPKVEIGADIQAYTDLPSSEFNGYPQGTVKVWVHAQDEAGNWGPWTEQDLGLDKTEPIILDQTTAVKEPVPFVTRTGFNPITGIGTYNLHFYAEDPVPTGAPPCNPGSFSTPPGCGVQSKVAAIEWTISYVDSVDISEINDFVQWFHQPGPLLAQPLGNGPENLTVNISGGPQPYTAPAKVEFRIMDGAGNWTNWYYTNLP